jgi:hypothetical protein
VSAVRFAQAKIAGPDGRVLHLDGNSKITRGNGTYDAPAANSFSLVEVDDCPGSTPTCRAACYVQGLRVTAPEVHARYEDNSRTIREILELPYLCVRDWAGRLGAWITANASQGFRWHVSGDIFSQAYAHFIADVVRYSPTVPHWIYTRSHSFIGPLVRLDNLAVNLSADRDNLWGARAARAQYRAIRELRIAYLVDASGYVPRDLPAGSVLFPDYNLRGRDLERPVDAAWWQGLTPAQRRMVCPVDFFGASESLRCGPCRKCLKP